MVIIPTSVWSHNCGMHVIADYLRERVQKSNFEILFSGPAYTALLNGFKTFYRHRHLTWPQLRALSMETSVIDSQIMWGYVLRSLLPGIINNHAGYKEAQQIHFLAVLNLVRTNQLQGAEADYPILLSSNLEYVLNNAAIPDNAVADIAYWNNIGFDRYCNAIFDINQDGENFAWLGIDELTACCVYFGINPVFNDFNAVNVNDNVPRIFFVNNGGHWERQSLELSQADALGAEDSYFYYNYLSKGKRFFSAHAAALWQIYFSEQYFELPLSPEVLKERHNALDLDFAARFTNRVDAQLNLDLAISLSFDFAAQNTNNKALLLRAQTFLLCNISPENLTLNAQSLLTISAGFRVGVVELIGNLVSFLRKSIDYKDLASAAYKSLYALDLICAKKACTAISANNKANLLLCFSSNRFLLIVAGQFNPLHHALRENKLDVVRRHFVEYITSPVDAYLNANIDRTSFIAGATRVFNAYFDDAYDDSARTLSFRLDRVNSLADMKARLSQSKSWLQSALIYALLTRFYANESRIYAVDVCYKKSAHVSIVQAKKAYSVGYWAMLMMRSAGVISSSGVVRYGIDIVRKLVPSIVQKAATYSVSKVTKGAVHIARRVSGAAGPRTKRQQQDEEQYEHTIESYAGAIAGNAIVFALMPQYYVVSTAFSWGVYVAFKDSGYDNLEAMCYVLADAATLSIVSENQSPMRDGAAYQYHLNKNLVPFIGETVASYVAPLVTFADISTRRFDGFVGYYSSMIINHVTYYNSISVIECPSILVTAADVVKQGRVLQRSVEDLAFDAIELLALRAMPDSGFTADRCYDIQLIMINRWLPDWYISVFIKKPEELFNLTTGYVHHQSWEKDYIIYKNLELGTVTAGEKRNLAQLKQDTDTLFNTMIFYSAEHMHNGFGAQSKEIDKIYASAKNNLFDVNSFANVIEESINKGIDNYFNRNTLAKFLADEIIRFKHPFYPYAGNAVEIEAERQNYINELSTHKLDGYHENVNEKDRHRVERRAYEYMLAKISNNKEKRHIHRWEDFIKPVANEICAKFGYKPFKDFKGGENSGVPGVQFNYNSGNNGGWSCNLASSGMPIVPLYNSSATNKPKINLSSEKHKVAEPMIVMEGRPQISVASQDWIGSMVASQDKAKSLVYQKSYKDALLGASVSIKESVKVSKPSTLTKRKNVAQAEVKAKSETNGTAPGQHKSTAQSLPQSRVVKQNWWSMAYQSATGVDSVLVKTWRAENIVNAPKWLLELNYGVQASTIPATRLPGLVFDSVVELGGELIDGAVDLSKFTYRELKHVVKGESLETSKAVAIMGKFIGEEAARFALKEPSESVKIAQKMVANFNVLTPEEKFKSLTKLYVSFFAIPTAASQIKKTSGEVAGIVVKTENKIVAQQPKAVLFSEKAIISKAQPVQYNAANVNAQVALNTKMRALEKAQNEAVKKQEFTDGRIRYYMPERLSHTPGVTRGSSHVTEYTPYTGQVRSWRECYDHQGNINRIHPKMIDGQQIQGQHYPPTKKELELIKKLEGLK